MFSYVFIVIFILVSLYLANSFKNEKLHKPIIEQVQEKANWRNDLLEVGKVEVNNQEVHFGIFSKKLFDANVEHIIVCIQSQSKDYFEIRQSRFIEKVLVRFSLIAFSKKLKSLYGNSIYIASDNQKFHNLLSDEDSINKIKNIIQKEPYLKGCSFKLYNLDNEFCMKFSFNKRPKLKQINMNKIFDIYAEDFLSIFNQLELNKVNEINHYEKVKNKMKNLKFILSLAMVGSFFTFLYNAHKVFPQVIDTSSLMFLSILGSSFIT
ncbi:MAG TPA: hypothetical protein ENK91_08690, partial [Bacteroidetes bacterium]|nr:hypothetical protein [Bacteroidota bacterium]